jgi:cob(I)alamin adenosyltransferase
MLPGMEQNLQDAHPLSSFDAQIGALLDRVQDQASIVDRLLAMPLPAGEDQAPEWDAAVARRLERRLAATMREMIEAEPEQRSA